MHSTGEACAAVQTKVAADRSPMAESSPQFSSKSSIHSNWHREGAVVADARRMAATEQSGKLVIRDRAARGSSRTAPVSILASWAVAVQARHGVSAESLGLANHPKLGG
ncbi:unnamed protein product [Symbiodinium sp. CCMP2592]|nr:unnamed protein product [Symbiodinium sp. CCMP2592]